MKERPILFSSPMVRAILAGTKTQTRRVVKPQPHHGEVGRMVNLGGADWAMDDGDLSGLWSCPYGQPGDRLWVRETWAAVHFSIDPETGFADDWHGSHDIPPGDGGGYWSKLYAADNHPTDKEERGFAWRPSIHMPRWASRITLEVTGVRVERLQDIMERDVFAEGIEKLEVHANTGRNGGAVPTGRFKGLDNWSDSEPYWVNPVDAFAGLWESINGAGSWAANPSVWVVEFRRLT